MRILIIKTGYSETFRPDLTYTAVSYGDILRTTPILHLLKGDEVHWLTDAKGVPLLYGLKEISTIHLVNTLDVLGLETYSWDRIINLEYSRGACQLAERLTNPRTEFIGYSFDKVNQKTLLTTTYKGENWSEKLFSLFGKKWVDEPYLIPHKKRTPIKNLVFLNRTVGPKLPSKKWGGWGSLETKLRANNFDTISQKSLKIEDFIAELQRAEYVISTDSLGLHIALGLNKPTLGLFGPTSAKEVPGLTYFIQEKLSRLSSEKAYKKFITMRKKIQ